MEVAARALLMIKPVRTPGQASIGSPLHSWILHGCCWKSGPRPEQSFPPKRDLLQTRYRVLSPVPHDAEHVVKGLQSDILAFSENKPKKTIIQHTECGKLSQAPDIEHLPDQPVIWPLKSNFGRRVNDFTYHNYFNINNGMNEALIQARSLKYKRCWLNQDRDYNLTWMANWDVAIFPSHWSICRVAPWTVGSLTTRVSACIASVDQFREVVCFSVVAMGTLGSPGLARVTWLRHWYIPTIWLTVAIRTRIW